MSRVCLHLVVAGCRLLLLLLRPAHARRPRSDVVELPLPERGKLSLLLSLQTLLLSLQTLLLGLGGGHLLPRLQCAGAFLSVGQGRRGYDALCVSKFAGLPRAVAWGGAWGGGLRCDESESVT